MDNTPPPESHDQTTESPEAEVLKPRADDGTPAVEAPSAASTTSPVAGNGKKPRRRTYRPSHKATFIGLAAVIIILAVNAAILGVVLKNKAKPTGLANTGQVSISSSVLSKIGVNTGSLGDSGIQLVVDPNAQFNGTLTVAGNVTIGGQLKLNSTFTASNANLTQLEAGNTSLSQLEVNGNSTLSALVLRDGLTVDGATQLEGAVTIAQLLTVDSNLNVSGNVSVGGSFSTNTFSARSLTSTSTLTIAGHVITGGSSPGVGPGGSVLGSNGTVGISGDDTAGAISVNIGAGPASSGIIANVAFKTQYSSTPRVVITPIGNEPGEFYVTNLTVAGFSVGVNNAAFSTGGFTIDYIVEQ